MFRTRRRHQRITVAKRTRGGPEIAVRLPREDKGSAILEFAISLPLLVVFVVGIYDFSGAFNQKQKIAQAAQEGAILAASQPMNDINALNPNPAGPDSLQPVVTAVFNSLAGSAVFASGTCALPAALSRPPGQPLGWTYTVACTTSSGADSIVITINRGLASTAVTPAVIGSKVTVSYPYHWRFNSVIQVLIPGASYALPPQITESATVHNQT